MAQFSSNFTAKCDIFDVITLHQHTVLVSYQIFGKFIFKLTVSTKIPFLLLPVTIKYIVVNPSFRVVRRGGYRISQKEGVGCREYGYFILGHFVAGHITRCIDKMSGDKILGGTKRQSKLQGGGGGGGGGAKCQYYQTLYI